MTNTHNIGIIGTGRLGLSFALLCAQEGYAVYGHDIRQDHIDSLTDRTYTTSEPYINEFLAGTRRAVFTTELSTVIRQCDVLFCFVATPSLPDGSYDHKAIEDIVSDMQRLHVQGMELSDKILVIGCTTMPGYCNIVSERLQTAGVSVVYNPEFIAQGDIINGLRTADMVLIGTDKESSVHALQGIYRTIMDIEPRFNVMSRTAAEITKISINCYLTMKIAYANMIGEIAINSGIENEVDIVLSAIGDDSRIGNKYLRYGFGYGGPCLPRDMRALGIHADNVGVHKRIPVAVDHSNNFHAEYLFDYFTAHNPDKNIPFIFSQLSYKKGTDMLVESQQFRLASTLSAHGYTIYTTDTVKAHIPQLPVGVTGYTIEL